ncbi:augmin subunit 5 [Quercus suber]|uniref:Augmin subunit 5 n=1 Tax=Quercus suber TaxID=58331 RepID=A0AAW0LFT0_QUESU
MEFMGANVSTGSGAVAAAERSAALLTARAGSLDLSAIPSIFHVSAALQYPAGAHIGPEPTTQRFVVVMVSQFWEVVCAEHSIDSTVRYCSDLELQLEKVNAYYNEVSSGKFVKICDLCCSDGLGAWDHRQLEVDAVLVLLGNIILYECQNVYPLILCSHTLFAWVWLSVEDIECSDVADVIVELNLLSASKEGNGDRYLRGNVARFPTGYLRGQISSINIGIRIIGIYQKFRYTDDMELDDAVHMAILMLKEG